MEQEYCFEVNGQKYWLKVVNGELVSASQHFEGTDFDMPIADFSLEQREKFSAAIRDGTAKLQNS